MTKPCPQIDHAHDLHLFRVITGPTQQVQAVTDPIVEDGALYFWAVAADDIWAILHQEAVTAYHAVYAADLGEIRHPSRWRLQ